MQQKDGIPCYILGVPSSGPPSRVPLLLLASLVENCEAPEPDDSEHLNAALIVAAGFYVAVSQKFGALFGSPSSNWVRVYGGLLLGPLIMDTAI